MPKPEVAVCPICQTSGAAISPAMHGRKFDYSCRRCGDFTLTDEAQRVIQSTNPGGRGAANASAWVREHQGVEIWQKNTDDLWRVKAPSVAARAVKVIQEFDRRWPSIGQVMQIELRPSIDPRWLAVSWSENVDEFVYLCLTYLKSELNALTGIGTADPGGSGWILSGVSITPKGYDLLEKRRSANPDSPIGFCAMWFADDLKPLWTDGIEPGIRAAGYDPKRIDQHEHVNRIDEEIVAMIRRSKFVVADFTGQRGGVYFEAGFALGLGLRVVWLCRDDELEAGKLHFDTRQYNFLRWKPGEYADLAKRLTDRIEATLGKGPLKQQ